MSEEQTNETPEVISRDLSSHEEAELKILTEKIANMLAREGYARMAEMHDENVKLGSSQSAFHLTITLTAGHPQQFNIKLKTKVKKEHVIEDTFTAPDPEQPDLPLNEEEAESKLPAPA